MPLNPDALRPLLVDRIDQKKQATGMVAGVVDSQGRHTYAYGTFAKGDPRAVGGDTLFEIGSLTKVFTSLLLADMVQRNEVALDGPAARYLPGHVRMPERDGKPITLLHLSTHTSGLPRLPGNLSPKDPANPYAGYSADDLYEFLSTCTLPRDPGAEVEYSNLGAGLLGHILALRAGTDYETLVRTRIAEPLGLTDTVITLSPAQQQRMASGHNLRLEPTPLWDLSVLAGAGALRSTVNDLLTLLEAFLGNRETPLAAAMQAMLAARRPVGKTPFEVSLGWNLVSDCIWHDGGTGGFCAFMGYDRVQRTGIVALANAFALRSVDELGMQFLSPKFQPSAPPAPTPEPGLQLDPAILDRYIGRYQLAADRVFEIMRDGDRLFAQASAQSVPGPKFELAAETETQFRVNITKSQISFETGPDGQATHMVMQRAGGQPTRAPRLP